MRLAPLRPFDRVVGGYATLAFGLAAGEGIAARDWLIAGIGLAFFVSGVALLIHDHRRWRSERRAATDAVTEPS